jgi:hypothetical protein
VHARAQRLSLSVRAVVLVIAAAAVWWVIHGVAGSGDYQPGGPVGGDNAAPAIGALIHGHLTALAQQQPFMGLVSLVWRAPFTGGAVWLGGSPHLAYQLGTLACLLPILGAALWLAGRARSPAQCVAAAAAVALIAGGPTTVAAATLGHPEEVLAAALAAGAVIVAGWNRPMSAAVLLGLAVGTKPWALIAVPCVLLTLSTRRTASAALSAAVAMPALALLPLLNRAAFGRVSRQVDGPHLINPLSVWWPTGAQHLGAAGVRTHVLPLALTRSTAAAIVLALACAGIWAYARRAHGSTRDGRPAQIDGLALLAVLGLVRCLADPLPDTYYLVALVIPLALWEAGTLRRLPLLAALVSVAVDWVPRGVGAAGGHGPAGLAVLNALWLGAGVALGVYLVRAAVQPRGEAIPGQDDGRASGWRGRPSSGIGSQAAA